MAIFGWIVLLLITLFATFQFGGLMILGMGFGGMDAIRREIGSVAFFTVVCGLLWWAVIANCPFTITPI
jgi:hypothetical protein